MQEEPELPEIPTIPQIEKTEEEKKAEEIEEKVTEEEKEEETVKTESIATQQIKKISSKIQEAINIDVLKPNIQATIVAKLKEGDVILVGEKIGNFAEKMAEEGHNVFARDTSATYVTPRAEVNNHEVLDKIDIKPFNLNKFKELKGYYRNIILFFALKRLSKQEIEELLKKCKELLSREGQLIIVDEFYPLNPILWLVTMIKIGFLTIREYLTKQRAIKPCKKLDKLIRKLELKFYDVKHEAEGRIRTYIVSKRWSALLEDRLL